MTLTGYKVYRNNELLYDNVDIGIPNIPYFCPVVTEKMEQINEELTNIVNFQTVDGGDIRKGAIDI